MSEQNCVRRPTCKNVRHSVRYCAFDGCGPTDASVGERFPTMPEIWRSTIVRTRLPALTCTSMRLPLVIECVVTINLAEEASFRIDRFFKSLGAWGRSHPVEYESESICTLRPKLNFLIFAVSGKCSDTPVSKLQSRPSDCLCANFEKNFAILRSVARAISLSE
jgi:hypothetical protein